MTQIQALCILTVLGFLVLGWGLFRLYGMMDDIREAAARAGLHADAAFHEAQRAASCLCGPKPPEDAPESFCATEGL